MANIIKTFEKDGRKYGVSESGRTTLTRTFVVVYDALPNTFPAMFNGIPKIGEALEASDGDFVVDHYDITDGKDADKFTRRVDVVYNRSSSEIQSEEGSDDVECRVEKWGWSDGTESRELITEAEGQGGADAKRVVNSASDVFENAPTIDTAAPTFTKVMRFKNRRTGWFAYNCQCNQESMTISGVTFAAGTLRASCMEEKVLDDCKFPYRYTVNLKYRSNMVAIGGDTTPTEIGWDTAIIDAGMREKSDNGTLVRIAVINSKTGESENVTSPELLDGSGKAVNRTGSHDPTPFVLRFRAYKRVNFPAWFTSEPATPTDPTIDEEED